MSAKLYASFNCHDEWDDLFYEIDHLLGFDTSEQISNALDEGDISSVQIVGPFVLITTFKE